MLREYFLHEQDFARNTPVTDNEYLKQILSKAQEIARTKAEQVNLVSCASVLCNQPESKLKVLRELFQPDNQSLTLETIRACAKRYHLKENSVWDTVRSVSQEIARARGLI
jgi:hypothetical protein